MCVLFNMTISLYNNKSSSESLLFPVLFFFVFANISLSLIMKNCCILYMNYNKNKMYNNNNNNKKIQENLATT